jgi:inner membrane protein
MTFVTFYFFEKFFRIRIHEMQYLLVGLALSLFFLLLIAISEQLPFMWAYVIASVSTIIQITWYTKTFSRGLSKNFWKVMTVTLSMLYSYLYILLQLENLSLLFGSIGLFVMLTGILYTTRNINWYGDEPKPEFKEWN